MCLIFVPFILKSILTLWRWVGFVKIKFSIHWHTQGRRKLEGIPPSCPHIRKQLHSLLINSQFKFLYCLRHTSYSTCMYIIQRPNCLFTCMFVWCIHVPVRRQCTHCPARLKFCTFTSCVKMKAVQMLEIGYTICTHKL